MVGLPGATELTLSVLVTVRCAWARVSLSVALTGPPPLASGLMLVKPDGGVTVTVLDKEPVAEDPMTATTVYVMEPPEGMFTMSSMLPDPDGLKPEALPEAVAVHVSELMAWMTDTGSYISAPVRSLGPVLA